MWVNVLMPGIRHDDHDDDESGMAPTVTSTVCSQINRSSVVYSKRRVECGVYRILIVFATPSTSTSVADGERVLEIGGKIY